MKAATNSAVRGDEGAACAGPAGSAPLPSAGIAARAAILATEGLLSDRSDDGYWRGRASIRPVLAADAILFELWMDQPQEDDADWRPRNRALVDVAVERLLELQHPDGSFSDPAAQRTALGETAKAYCALKLAGVDPDCSPMTAARERVLALGGLAAADSLTKIELSFFELFPAEACPVLPVEMLIMPGNPAGRLPTWTRAVAVPLALVQAHAPRKRVPPGFDLSELFRPEASAPGTVQADRWDRLIGAAQHIYRCGRWMIPSALRQRGIKAAEGWLMERLDAGGDSGTFYRPLLYSVLALDLLGYSPQEPPRRKAELRLRCLLGEEDACDEPAPDGRSPVWETAVAVSVIGRAGKAPQVMFERTADWLLSKEVRREGDWAWRRPAVEPGGWYTGFANEYYPDAGTTATVLLALRHMRSSDLAAQEAAARRAIRWLLAMQSRDGSWALFDGECSQEPFQRMSFGGRYVSLDEHSADITGLVMQALCDYGLTGSDPSIRRAIDYLVGSQRLDGSWYGRVGGSYLSGTALALQGLRCAGSDLSEPHILHAAEWLRSIQSADGGWGEEFSGPDADYLAGPSSPSRTAWGVAGLVAAGELSSGSAERGVQFLVDQQQDNGAWQGGATLGTVFPGVLDFAQGRQRDFFPLVALGVYLNEKSLPQQELA